MNRRLQAASAALLIIFALGFVSSVFAAGADGSEHKIVIQVSTDDPGTQKLAINNAANLQKEYGMDNVTVEVVAYGPGLSILTSGNAESPRVKSLAVQGIQFSACGNTIKGVEKRTGTKPELTEGVTIVPAGVGRIMELQEQGYAYVRP